MRGLLFVAALLSTQSTQILADGFDTHQINVTINRLNQANTTLLYQLKGLNHADDDKSYGLNVNSGALSILDALYEFDDLGYLYRTMENPADAEKIKALILENKGFFAKTCGNGMGYINESLSPIKNTVILGSSEQVRDQAQTACDLIKNWE